MIAESKAIHAFYSPTAAARWGTSIYLALDGVTEVEVTAVNSVSITREEAEQHYQWEDRVYLGLVTRWLRKGRTGPDERTYEPLYERPRAITMPYHLLYGAGVMAPPVSSIVLTCDFASEPDISHTMTVELHGTLSERNRAYDKVALGIRNSRRAIARRDARRAHYWYRTVKRWRKRIYQ